MPNSGFHEANTIIHLVHSHAQLAPSRKTESEALQKKKKNPEKEKEKEKQTEKGKNDKKLEPEAVLPPRIFAVLLYLRRVALLRLLLLLLLLGH